jgi:hypothetical protein
MILEVNSSKVNRIPLGTPERQMRIVHLNPEPVLKAHD